MQPDNRVVFKRLIIVLALALIGLGLSASLSFHYYDLRSGAGEFKSFCNMNEMMNCDAVAASSFAEIFAGFPLASFSGGWYLAMAILSLMAMGDGFRKSGSRALVLMSAVGVVFSIAYFVIMMSVIQKYCLQCLLIDGVNLGLLAVTATLWKISPSKKGESGQWTRVAGVVAGTLLITVLFFKSYDRSGMEGITHDELADSMLNATVQQIDIPAQAPVMGAANAPVTIVEFSDFQCPHCKNGAKIMHTLMERFPGKLRVVYRGYPLDQSCNQFMKSAGHPVACEATKVAMCAGAQGKFKAVYEAIFENQASLKPGLPMTLATEAGADPDQLKTCLATPDTGILVKQAIEQGNLLGVKSTPTFFLNGRKVEGAYPVPVWVKAIERLLAGQ